MSQLEPCHGVSASDQHLLATAACRAVFGSQSAAGTPLNSGGQPRSAATVSAVTAATDSTDADQAAQLRNQLADWISGRGTFQTPGVEQAFRTVSRHEFLPGHPLEDAYSRKPVVTQRAPDGSSTSSASSPNLVAQMLEQLQAEPGNTVLEIGAATGFNAALLASLTGPGGKVVTIEYDPGLAGQAAANLRRAGYPQVQVIADDGALGHQEHGPYDTPSRPRPLPRDPQRRRRRGRLAGTADHAGPAGHAVRPCHRRGTGPRHRPPGRVAVQPQRDLPAEGPGPPPPGRPVPLRHQHGRREEMGSGPGTGRQPVPSRAAHGDRA